MKTRLGSNGFTFLEVLVALTLLSVTVAMAVQLFSSSLRSIASSDDYLRAMKTAEFRMRRIIDQDKFVKGSWTETADGGYRMNISISDTLNQRTDSLSVSLLQVRVAVSWKSGSKDKTWTVQTLKAIDKRRIEIRSVEPGRIETTSDFKI